MLARLLQNKQLRLTVIALLVGVVALLSLIFMRRSPELVEPKKVAAIVETLPLKLENIRAKISGYGEVSASQALKLQPQISGYVTEISPKLRTGGMFLFGELLVQLDRTDYQAALDSARAALARAELELKLEQGNKRVAEEEWNLLKNELETTELGKALALREPQLKEKKASFEAAKSQVEKAKRDLANSSILAPFDLMILAESVEKGSFLSPQSVIADVVGTHSFEITVRVARQDLFWLSGMALSELSSRVRAELSNQSDLIWEGRVTRILGDVDPNGRMSGLVVEVVEPLTANPPLLLGSYVKVETQGQLLRDIYKIPRSALRNNNQIWLVDEDSTLEKHTVDVVFSSADFYAVHSSEDLETKRLIVSGVETALEGMLLRPRDTSAVLESQVSDEDKDER